MPRLGRHQGPETGGRDPAGPHGRQGADQAPPHSVVTSPPSERRSPGLSPGLCCSQATPRVAPSNKRTGFEPHPPRGSENPEGARDTAPAPGPRARPQGHPRPAVPTARAQAASLTPPWPRSGSASVAQARAPPSQRAGGRRGARAGHHD